MALVNLKTIEDSTILAMANSKKFTDEFSFLLKAQQVARKTSRTCSTCDNGKKERTRVLQNIKAGLAGMGSERKRRLKELLNAKKVRISYTMASGKIVTLTF